MWGVFHRAAELVVSDQHIEVFATRPTQSGQLTRRRCSITFDPRNIFVACQTNVRSWETSGRHLLMLSVSQFDPTRTSNQAGCPHPEVRKALILQPLEITTA